MSDIKLIDRERLAVRVGKRDGACRDGWWISDGHCVYYSHASGWVPLYDTAGSLMRFPLDNNYTEPNWAYMLEQLIWEGEIRHVEAGWLYKWPKLGE